MKNICTTILPCLAFATIFTMFFLPGCGTKASADFVQRNFDFAAGQLTLALNETGAIIRSDTATQVSPRTLDKEGNLELVSSRDWTSGFFPGELWYMYEYTGADSWAEAARSRTALIEREKSNGTTHDMGFKICCSFGNGYRLTGDPHYREVLLESARTLATRYNPAVKAIRSWDHSRSQWDFPVIIDNMMNLELLFRAFRESGDSTFYRVAVDHAETTMKNHFRADYSTYHVIGYDPLSGRIVQRNTHQGYAHESTWSRGQGWAIYGFTMCYRETGRADFLAQAIRAADYFFDHPNLPEDGIPYWDFDAPVAPDTPRDVSAAAVVASALYELSTCDKERGSLWRDRADRITENLSNHYLAPAGGAHGFLLLHSTGSKAHDSEVDVPLVYADYYFLEALLRKQKLDRLNPVIAE
jgi:hypothetical protein